LNDWQWFVWRQRWYLQSNSSRNPCLEIYAQRR
jgi:hypothetical protein